MRGSVCSENRFIVDLPFECDRICRWTEPRPAGGGPDWFRAFRFVAVVADLRSGGSGDPPSTSSGFLGESVERGAPAPRYTENANRRKIMADGDVRLPFESRISAEPIARLRQASALQGLRPSQTRDRDDIDFLLAWLDVISDRSRFAERHDLALVTQDHEAN